MDTAQLAVIGTVAAAIVGFFLKLRSDESKERKERREADALHHATLRTEDRADRKELVEAVRDGNEKVASGIHELTVSMSTGFAHLDEKIQRLQDESRDDKRAHLRPVNSKEK